MPAGSQAEPGGAGVFRSGIPGNPEGPLTVKIGRVEADGPANRRFPASSQKTRPQPPT